MSDLTDLEVCKRIAEIEGKQIMKVTSSCVFVFNDGESCQYFKEKVYNPLKDDALCFQLIKKYKVSLVFDNNEWEAEFCYQADLGVISPDETVSCFVSDVDANKAVCLAIIESHETQ